MGLDASGTCRTVDGWDLREGAGDAKLRGEVLAGLSSPRPYLPSRLLGEALPARAPFEEVTTATSGTEAVERRILERAAVPLARLRRTREMVLLDPDPALDASPLLEALVDADALRRVLLLGVDRAGLVAAAGSISRRWNALSVRWLCCDPTEDLGVVGRARDRLVVLLGGRLSTIGAEQSSALLTRVAGMLEPGGMALVGLRLSRAVVPLAAACGLRGRATDARPLDLLRVVNERLGSDFDPSCFTPVARAVPAQGAVELRLRAIRPSRVRIAGAGLDLRFGAGTEIRASITRGYTRAALQAELRRTGLRIRRWFSDRDGRLADVLLERGPGAALGGRRRAASSSRAA